MNEDKAKRERALEKIKKCLALSESSNPHEAQSALRQARKLMEMYQLESSDVDASRAEEFALKIGDATRVPAQWVRMLANVVAEAMGCICFFRYGTYGQALIFIGERGNGELSAYAFEVLHRQLLATKKSYLASLPNYGVGQKRKMGTLYTEGWIRAVGLRVEQFAGVSEEAERAINAYREKHYPNVPEMKLKRRVVNDLEYAAHERGEEDGKTVSLHKPMGQEDLLRLT